MLAKLGRLLWWLAVIGISSLFVWLGSLVDGADQPLPPHLHDPGYRYPAWRPCEPGVTIAREAIE